MRLTNAAALAAILSSAPALHAAPDATKRGFPLGEKSRLHTNFDLQAAYDTNPDRQESDKAIGDLKLTFRPGFEVDVPGNAVAFGLTAKLSIEQFLGVEAGRTSDTRFGGDVGLNFRAGSSKSVVGFELSNNLTRTPTFFDALLTVSAAEIQSPLWFNTGSASLVLRPGGGALEFRAGYTNVLNIYDALPDAQQHGVALQAKLRFLPKTAAVFDANLSFYTETAEQNPQSARVIPDARAAPYNVTVGLVGQLTPRLTTVAKVGFGDALSFVEGQDLFGTTLEQGAQRTVIGTLKFEYTFGDQKTLFLAYDRRVFNAVVVRSYVSDMISGGFDLGFGERLTLGAGGAFEFRGYPKFESGMDRGAAQVALADARATYWFLPFLSGTIGYQLQFQGLDDLAKARTEFQTYGRHMAFVNIGLRY